METMLMENKITVLKTPITVNIQDWMGTNEGTVGVGKRIGNTQDVILIAYQKTDCPTQQIREYAKNNDAMLLISISDGGISAID